MDVKVEQFAPSRLRGAWDLEEGISRSYDVQKRIGQGAYGRVWKAVHRGANRVVAVKKIFNAFDGQVDAKRTFREINYLSALKGHPNIIRLLTLHKASNNKDIYLIFEYMDIDLHAYIKKGLILQEPQIRFITYQLLCALKYIHSASVVHRDLKPANILLNVKCEAKIADFGLARNLKSSIKKKQSIEVCQQGGDEDYEDPDPPLTEYVATRWYRPPEILLFTKKYSESVDMWALGCILAEMYNCEPLFPGKSTVNQLHLILKSVPQTPKPGEKLYRRGSTGHIDSSIRTTKRPRIEGILYENSCAEAKDLLSDLLVILPSKRITAAEALCHPYLSRYYTGTEPVIIGELKLPLSEEKAFETKDYRGAIYSAIDDSRRTTLMATVSFEQRRRNGRVPNSTMPKIHPQGSVKQHPPNRFISKRSEFIPMRNKPPIRRIASETFVRCDQQQVNRLPLGYQAAWRFEFSG